MNIVNLYQSLSTFPQVQAIALGGSRAGENFDKKSDYDVYLYITAPIPEDQRKAVLEEYCTRMEIGNHYWELEDNCTLKNGCDIDILYRNLESFQQEVASVVEDCISHNGYTTCLWHNVINSKIIFDRQGEFATMQKRFQVSYPQQLKKNIIENNMKLLDGYLPSYSGQIAKAVDRMDLVSINHRVTEFLASYFDILFALNEQTHPGEKRLVEMCKKNCQVLPKNFEENLNLLFASMLDVKSTKEVTVKQIATIVEELKKII